ncbi:MAG: hypothetical protein GY711_16730 [bacterium]|nr:hypothetical protein [bacterium]
MPPTEARAPLDRDALREISRRWSSSERRLLIERVLEHLPEEELERLLEGLVHLARVRCDRTDPRHLDDRVADHVASTRHGDFLGDLVIRNAHGQREPWQTRAWVAATSLLFDLALDCARNNGTEDALRSLVALAEEVDERIDELVVLEDSSAREEFWHSLQAARSLLSRP